MCCFPMTPPATEGGAFSTLRLQGHSCSGGAWATAPSRLDGCTAGAACCCIVSCRPCAGLACGSRSAATPAACSENAGHALPSSGPARRSPQTTIWTFTLPPVHISFIVRSCVHLTPSICLASWRCMGVTKEKTTV